MEQGCLLYILQTGFTMCGFVYTIFICLQSHILFCLHFDVHFYLCSLESHSALISSCLSIISESQRWQTSWALYHSLVFSFSCVHLVAVFTLLPCSLCSMLLSQKRSQLFERLHWAPGSRHRWTEQQMLDSSDPSMFKIRSKHVSKANNPRSLLSKTNSQ